MNFCECGCGGEAPIAKKTTGRLSHVKGQPVRFINGHQNKRAEHRARMSRLGKTQARENSPTWRGGRRMGHGYVMIKLRDHPRSNTEGYVYEHILIAERALGYPLPEGAVVHHVNEIKSDNRNTNLVICNDDGYHRILHARARLLRTQREGAKGCNACGETKQLAAFYADTSKADGRRSICIQCTAQRRSL